MKPSHWIGRVQGAFLAVGAMVAWHAYRRSRLGDSAESAEESVNRSPYGVHEVEPMEKPLEAIHDVAHEILKLVGTNPPSAPVATRDITDELLCVAYGRAFRCFQSITELAGRYEADDAFVLTRTLLYIALNSLYITKPDNASEREQRHRSAALASMKAEVRMIEEQGLAGFDVSAAEVDRVKEMIARLEQIGTPSMPPLEQVAKDVGFDAFYPRVFRPASAIAHYSIWSALDGYEQLPRPDTGPLVSLVLPAPERSIEVLELACITYGAFLEKSDAILGHGLVDSTKALMRSYLDAQERD